MSPGRMNYPSQGTWVIHHLAHPVMATVLLYHLLFKFMFHLDGGLQVVGRRVV